MNCYSEANSKHTVTVLTNYIIFTLFLLCKMIVEHNNWTNSCIPARIGLLTEEDLFDTVSREIRTM